MSGDPALLKDNAIDYGAVDYGAFDDDSFHDGELIEWYSARPLTVSTAAACGSVLAAFALGAVTALAATALLRHFDD